MYPRHAWKNWSWVRILPESISLKKNGEWRSVGSHYEDAFAAANIH
jgi:hypothetical protein